MSEEQLEVTASSGLSVASYRSSLTIPEPLSEVRLPAPPSSLRRTAGRLVRQAYGLFKLASAPRETFRLITARPDTTLGKLVAQPGRKGALASQPFVCSKWSAALRLRRMIQHCTVVDELGHPFNINGDQYIEIIHFELDGERCRLMLDRPKWLGCDGMLCASLWSGYDRVFSVSFSLSDSGGERTTYIGGIQGHRSGDALDQNRMLTKAAHGMRPRDLAFELFRMLMPRMGVTQLKCVADAYRYQMTRRASMLISLNDKVQLDYNETWESRGGVLGDDGFYVVPANSRRDIAEISAKKRSMYKRRYAMLDKLQAEINLALDKPCEIHTHAPMFVRPRVAAG